MSEIIANIVNASPIFIANVTEAGPTGATGAKGETGNTGATGATGSQGVQGIQGVQGVQGIQGEHGVDAYVHIKWGTSATPETLLDTPSDYIGIVSTTSATPPATYTGYSWFLWKGIQGIQGETGATGAQGIQGIQGIQGDTGNTGATGNGIASVTLTSGNHAAGTTDTYTITFTDATTATFTVYNGANGIGAGDMLASVYDPTNKNTDAFSLANMVGDTTHRVVTDTEKTTWNAKQPATDTLTAETALVDGDYIPFYDTSTTSHKKTLWSNIKSVLKTYFDTLYATLAHTHGNITNDGKIGSTADLPVFTTTAGAVTTKTVADTKTLLGITENSYAKLLDVTVGTAASAITLDLSSLDMTQYNSLIVYCYIKIASGTSSYLVKINNITTNYFYKNYQDTSPTTGQSYFGLVGANSTYPASAKVEISYEPSTTSTQTVLCNTESVDYTGSAASIYNTVGGVNAALSAGVTAIKITGGTNISVGSKFVVYGVKK